MQKFDLKESFLVNFYQKLQAEKQQIHKKDFRFFQIDILLDLARRSQIYSKECKICSSNKQKLLQLVEGISEKLQSVSGRRNVSETINQIVKHLRNEHKIYLKGYLLSFWSFIGLVVFSVVGLLIGLIFKLNLLTAVLIGFMIGMFLGRIYGNIQEKKAVEQDRIISPQIITMFEEILRKSQDKNL